MIFKSAVHFLILFFCLLGWSSEAPLNDRSRVERVEVVGITAIESHEVESAVDVTVGEVIDRREVGNSISNLREALRRRGYEQTIIKTELVRIKNEMGDLETILKLLVDEGKPTRISQLAVTIESSSNTGSEKFLKEFEKTIVGRIGLSPGTIFDQEKVVASKRKILDVLAGENFINAKVTLKNPTEAQPIQDFKEPADRWLNLELVVDPGDQISFGFRGNQHFTYSKLSALIEEQRVLGFGSNYIESIETKIIDEYKRAAFAEVKIVPYSIVRGERAQRHITFAITEGPRYLVNSLAFEGVHDFSQGELTHAFYSKATILLQSRLYSERDIERAAELMIEWIKTRGYLSAKLVTITHTASLKHSNRINVVVYLAEGDQTLVREVTVKGAIFLSAGEITTFLGVSTPGMPLNLFYFSEGIESLKSKYRSMGFLDFAILNEGTDSVITYSNDNRDARITIDIREGVRYRFSNISIEGLEKTRENIVRRELLFFPGDLVEESLIKESEIQLRKLGIFSSVEVRLSPSAAGEGFKDARILVQEGTPGILAGGVGFRNDLGIRLFAETSYGSLWRRNHTIFFNSSANRRFDEEFCSNSLPGRFYEATGNCFIEGSAQLGYRWPWFVFDKVTFRPRITVERVQFRKFDADSLSVSPAWERAILRSPNLTGVLTYNLERIKQYHAQDVLDNGQFTIGSVTPSIYVDMRDDPLSPTRGIFSTFSYEVANRLFFSQTEPIPVGFTRAQFRTDFFHSFSSDLMIYLSFRSGIERNTEPPSVGTPDPKRYSIPISKQFVLGGAGSIRGFKEQELNTENSPILGTLSYVNYRAQVDFPFSGALRFGPFVDAANLLIDDYSFGRLRFGAGAGFRYRSPVGPINFDWGFKIAPRPGEDTSQFYFSVGVI